MKARSRALVGAAVVGVLLTVTPACSTFSKAGRDKYDRADGSTQSAPTAGTASSPGAASEAPVLPYDVRPLLHPKNKYFGVSVQGAPESVKPLSSYAALVGKKPNLVESYAAWGDQYSSQAVQNAWGFGAMSFIAWEPFKKSLADIAAGKDDTYIRDYARSVKELNLPVAISFAHEMNGFWYPWGTKKATPQQFVAAWQHVHDIFADEGATQVIWVWSPNVTNPVPSVKLKPFWPGADYVDWVGVIGYYAASGPSTYKTLYGPTTSEIRRFTDKPFLIAETAAEAGLRKPADVADLFQNTAKSDDFLGFVWFNYDKETDWRVNSGPASLAAFRKQAADAHFGFDVKRP